MHKSIVYSNIYQSKKLSFKRLILFLLRSRIVWLNKPAIIGIAQTPRNFSNASCRNRKREKEGEKSTDKNQLECHVDGWRAYFPVVVRTISRFHRSPIVVLPFLALALTFREGFFRSVNERRTAGRRKTRLPSSLSCTWVTWRWIGRRFIVRSCTTCTTTTAAQSNRMWDSFLDDRRIPHERDVLFRGRVYYAIIINI